MYHFGFIKRCVNWYTFKGHNSHLKREVYSKRRKIPSFILNKSLFRRDLMRRIENRVTKIVSLVKKWRKKILCV